MGMLDRVIRRLGTTVRRMSTAGACTTEPGFLSEAEARVMAASKPTLHAPLAIRPRLALTPPSPLSAAALQSATLRTRSQALRLTRTQTNQEPASAAEALRSAVAGRDPADGLGEEAHRVFSAFASAVMKRLYIFRAPKHAVMADTELADADEDHESLEDSSLASVMESALASSADDAQCSSVLKKRRHKMNKHKHKKRLRRDRYKSR